MRKRMLILIIYADCMTSRMRSAVPLLLNEANRMKQHRLYLSSANCFKIVWKWLHPWPICQNRGLIFGKPAEAVILSTMISQEVGLEAAVGLRSRWRQHVSQGSFCVQWLV
mmetsp:Transcript_99365/g.280387  ORF Transcript_99365/g.280387 Transcript_99365/m.280387 type:complete len:111 (+) Transcript_99365:243-575(+)